MIPLWKSPVVSASETRGATRGAARGATRTAQPHSTAELLFGCPWGQDLENCETSIQFIV